MKIIKLTKGKEAIVDDDVYEWASKYKWCYGGEGYAVRSFAADHSLRGMMSLHHAIMGHPITGLEIDHINGNKLDDRRENLRMVTHRINNWNRVFHMNGKVAGCYLTKMKRKNKTYYYWRAQMKLDNETIFLGHFDTEEEANKRYMEELTKRGLI